MITQILEPKDYSEKALEVYKSLGGVIKGEAIIPNADILVIRLAHKIDREWLDCYSNLKVIASPTTGLNHIDLEECEKRGIKVISLKGDAEWLGKNITSTAEHTWALILSLIRKIPIANLMVTGFRNWNRDNFIGHQLKGKTLGIIGHGRVGRQVAQIAKAFQMRIQYKDKGIITGKQEEYPEVTMQQLLVTSDIVSIHVDLNDSTYNLIRDEQFRMMKPTAYLINTSRGEVIDEEDLLMALKNEKIAGAALDVLWDESADGKHLENNPLVQYAVGKDNLIITPHIAGASYEAMRLTEERIAEKVLAFVRGI